MDDIGERCGQRRNRTNCCTSVVLLGGQSVARLTMSTETKTNGVRLTFMLLSYPMAWIINPDRFISILRGVKPHGL